MFGKWGFPIFKENDIPQVLNKVVLALINFCRLHMKFIIHFMKDLKFVEFLRYLKTI